MRGMALNSELHFDAFIDRIAIAEGIAKEWQHYNSETTAFYRGPLADL